MQTWSSEGPNRHFAVILCKDHRLRYPYFDYLKHGKVWNMPKPSAAISDASHDPQWWETSKDLKMTIVLRYSLPEYRDELSCLVYLEQLLRSTPCLVSGMKV
jgi:hypothetical protein